MVQEKTTVDAQLEAEKAQTAKYKVMAEQYQAEKAAGTPAHLIVPGTTPVPPVTPEAQHHARMAQPLLDKAAAIRAQVASGEKSDVLLVSAVGYELDAAKIARIAQEAPKGQTHPIPSPTPEKPLVERFNASLKVFLDWIKGKGGVQEPVGPSTRHDGPVVQLDDLHCVQKTGRAKFAIHELSKLDRVPVQDDPKTEIHYKNGLGQVKGQGLGKGSRAD